MARDALVPVQCIPIELCVVPNVPPLTRRAEVETWASVLVEGQPVCLLNACPTANSMFELQKERTTLYVSQS